MEVLGLLVHIKHNADGKFIKLRRDNTVGSGPGSNIKINSLNLDQNHFRIAFDSKNQSFIRSLCTEGFEPPLLNGKPISEGQTQIRHLDIIKINGVSFRFEEAALLDQADPRRAMSPSANKSAQTVELSPLKNSTEGRGLKRSFESVASETNEGESATKKMKTSRGSPSSSGREKIEQNNNNNNNINVPKSDEDAHMADNEQRHDEADNQSHVKESVEESEHEHDKHEEKSHEEQSAKDDEDAKSAADSARESEDEKSDKEEKSEDEKSEKEEKSEDEKSDKEEKSEDTIKSSPQNDEASEAEDVKPVKKSATPLKTYKKNKASKNKTSVTKTKSDEEPSDEAEEESRKEKKNKKNVRGKDTKRKNGKKEVSEEEEEKSSEQSEEDESAADKKKQAKNKHNKAVSSEEQSADEEEDVKPKNKKSAKSAPTKAGKKSAPKPTKKAPKKVVKEESSEEQQEQSDESDKENDEPKKTVAKKNNGKKTAQHKEMEESKDKKLNFAWESKTFAKYWKPTTGSRRTRQKKATKLR